MVSGQHHPNGESERVGVGRTKRLLPSIEQAGLPGFLGHNLAIDRQLTRLLSTQLAFDARLQFARALTATVVSDIMADAGLQPRPFPADIPVEFSDPQAKAAAKRLAQGIMAGPASDMVGLLGAVYTSALPDEYRAQHGIFYTPAPLTEHLLDMATKADIDWQTARVLDPACGGGGFLVAAAARMVESLSGVEPALVLKQLAHRLHGFEQDPFGAWLAQAALDIQLAPVARMAGLPVPSMVDTRDSLDLRQMESGSFDLVMGNPPYSRITLPQARRAVFARSTYGHANLYGLFTDAALRWVRRGGLVTYVTPTSMLSGLYHKALRALLAREGPPVAVHLVAERSGVFEDVLQETMLSVYRRGGRTRKAQVGFLSVGSNGQVTCSRAGTFTLPQDGEAPWLLPRAPNQVALTRQLSVMPHRLADYGYGVSTGPLVWNRFKPQLRATKGKRDYPVVWAESVTSDGRFTWRTERRNHAPWFAADLPRDAWLMVDRPCVLLQRTTAKEQARRLIAAEMPENFVRKHGAAIVENHLNMIRPIVPIPLIPSAAIATLLNSDAADAAFRCINGSVAVSAFELEAMPVPAPAVMLKVAKLLAGGAPYAEISTVILDAYAGRTSTGEEGQVLDAAAA